MANSNFNTNTIKEKFLNILFEPEEESQEAKKNFIEEVKRDTKVQPKVSTIKATDILYGKKDGNEHSNTFIDLNEITKEPPNRDSSEEYVLNPNISPIFGNIDEIKKTKKSNESTSLNYASVDKPSTSYLGTVLSPIYGYDSNGESEKETVNPKDVKDVDIVEDLGDIFATEEIKLSFEDDKTIEVTSDTFSSFYKKEED